MLAQIRRKVSDIVPYAAAQARLIVVYSGYRADEWFPIEVISCFKVLLEYRGGITFISRITEKIIDKCRLWDQTIVANMTSFLKHDNGCDLLRDFISANQKDSIVQDTAHSILSTFHTRNDSASRDLIRTIIQIYRDNAQVLQPRIQHQWSRATDCSFLVSLIEFTPDRIWRTTAACFLDNPLPFCKDVNSASVIIAILRREELEQQETIFARLLPGFPILAFSDPGWSIAHEMVNVGTIRQKLQMKAMIQPHHLPTV
jgi:hypothetical protein